MRSVYTICFASLFTVLASTGWALADQQDQAAAEEECKQSSVDYANDTTLTRQERLAAMDRALNKSLNKYDDCLENSNDTASSQPSGGSSGGTSGGSGSGTTSSAAASDIEGTQTPPATVATDNAADPKNDQTASTQPQKPASPNGKVPEDIPPADNDTVLEKQIRQAAINETDPVKKAKLWDEYRKYKGIPKTQH